MANEPERPIEKLLRAAAQRRRDDAGAPFELHPATRRLLQGEVARQFAKPQRETRSFLSLLAQLWPRIAWSVAILAVLGVTVWTLIQASAWHKQSALLASVEETQMAARLKSLSPSAPETPAAVTPPPAAMAPPSPAVVPAAEAPPLEQRKLPTPSPGESQRLAKDKFALATEGSLRETLPLAAAPGPADRPTVPQGRTVASSGAAAPAPVGFADDAAAARYGLAASATPPARAPAAPVPVASSALEGLKEARAARTVQRFVQLAPERGTKAGVAY